MIKKLFLLIIVMVGYIYLSTSGNDKEVYFQGKKLLNYCVARYKKMDVKIKVNDYNHKKKR